MYGNAAHAYRAQQVRGVSPAKQVALLYDRAIASLREAIQAIEDGEIERRWRANKRAQDIVFTLYGALDLEVGGEVAQNLERLYKFVMRRLPRVDLNNDPEPAREAIQILEPLRDSWHKIADQQDGASENTQSASAPAPSPQQTTGGGLDLAG